jgi:folate-binding protein YgfZ
VWAPFPGWALITVGGRDAGRFLHSQLTADVLGLGDRRSRLSALLDRSGRIRSYLFVLRAAGTFRLLVPEELADATVQHLENHVIADEVALAPTSTGPMTLLLGPAVFALADPVDDDVFPLEILGERGAVTWRGGQPPGLARLSDDEIAARRVVSGLPRWGLDVHDGQLVTETVLADTAVDHGKGCYLGQETVHKLSTRRGAAYAPVLIEIDPGGHPTDDLVGCSFTVDSKPGGEILDCARWDDRSFLEARLHRRLRVAGLGLRCRLEDGRVVRGLVRRLPLLVAPDEHETATRLVAYASSLFVTDREVEAVTALERAIDLCPGHADALEALGVALGRRGEYDRAIDVMQRLLDVDPASVMAHANLSLYYNRLGRIDDAERELERAQAARTSPLTLLHTPAGASAATDDPGDVDRQQRERMFLQVLDIDPEDAFALASLGEIRLQAGRHREAVDLLTRAIAAQPDQASAHLGLGAAWEALGDTDRAARVYSDGVRVAASAGAHHTADRMQERLAALQGG